MSKLFQRLKSIFKKNKDNQNDIKNDKNNNKFNNNNINFQSSSNNKNDEKKNNIIINEFNYSPEISFSRLPMLYHNDFSDKSWNGLKLSFGFKPTQFFNLEYALIIEKNKKLFNNYNLNASTLIPMSTIFFPINLILMGHKESSKAFSFQGHLLLGEKDKISIMTNNVPKDNNFNINNNFLIYNSINSNNNFSNNNEEKGIDINNNLNEENLNDEENKGKNEVVEIENNYSIEYCHEFKKGNIGLKITNLEPNSFSFLYSLYKNLYFGMEFFKNPNNNEEKKNNKFHFLKANYGIMLKQSQFNKFGFTFNYLSTLPGALFNCCYQINDNFKLYLNSVFNKNELLLKLGQEKFSSSLFSFYKNDFIELNTELSHRGEVKFMSKFNFNKYIDILTNFSYDHRQKKGKHKIKQFGFGLNIKNNSVEEKIEDMIKEQKKVFSKNNLFYKDYNNIMKLK